MNEMIVLYVGAYPNGHKHKQQKRYSPGGTQQGADVSRRRKTVAFGVRV